MEATGWKQSLPADDPNVRRAGDMYSSAKKYVGPATAQSGGSRQSGDSHVTVTADPGTSLAQSRQLTDG